MKTEKISADRVWKHFHKLFMIWNIKALWDKSNRHCCYTPIMTVSVIWKASAYCKKHLFSFPEASCRAELQTVALLLLPGCCSCSGCTNWLPRYDLYSRVTNLHEPTPKSQIVPKLHQIHLPRQKRALLHKLLPDWLKNCLIYTPFFSVEKSSIKSIQ